MELLRSLRFERSYANAPQQVQRAFDKQSLLLLHNLHDEGRNLWQARVNRSWRFYFLIQKDVYYIVDIVPHPK